MGLVGNSPVSLLLILCIILVLFGTNKVKQLGADLGEALKQFRRAVREDEDKNE